MRSAVVIVKFRGGEADPFESCVIVDVSLVSDEVEVAGTPFQGLSIGFGGNASWREPHVHRGRGRGRGRGSGSWERDPNPHLLIETSSKVISSPERGDVNGEGYSFGR